MSSLPDLVIRVGQPTEELRYTVRSLSKNLPHRNLWLAGVEVPWLNLPLIHVPQVPGKYAHAYQVLRAILTSQALTDDVIVADDDMVLLEPLVALPAYHRGPVKDLPQARRQQGIADTIATVGPDALCRDNHTPSLVSRALLLNQLGATDLPDERKPGLLWRTLHANGEPTYLPDAKVRREREQPQALPWISTCPTSWRGIAGELIRAQFSEPSNFETPPHP